MKYAGVAQMSISANTRTEKRGHNNDVIRRRWRVFRIFDLKQMHIDPKQRCNETSNNMSMKRHLETFVMRLDILGTMH